MGDRLFYTSNSRKSQLSVRFRAVTTYVFPLIPLSPETSNGLRVCIRKGWFAQDGVEPESRMINYILLLVEHGKNLDDIVTELVDLNALAAPQAMELMLDMHRVMLTLTQSVGECTVPQLTSPTSSISGTDDDPSEPPEEADEDDDHHQQQQQQQQQTSAPRTSYFHKISSKTNHSALQFVIDAESNGHSDRVYSVCFSSDSLFLYTGSRDRLIKKYRLVSPEGGGSSSSSFDYSVTYVGSLAGHTNTVTALASSSDSKRIVSGSMDYMVRLWDTMKMRCVRIFAGHLHYVLCVACSPDDSYAYSGSKDASINVWSLLKPPSVGSALPATMEPSRTLKGHSDRIRSIVLSPDGTTLFSGSDDKTISVWDMFSYQRVRTMTGYSSQITSLAISASGHHLFSASVHEVKIWDLRSYRHVHSIEGHTDIILSMASTPLGAHPRLYSASKDRLVKVWDLHYKRALHSLDEEVNPRCVNTVKKHFDSVNSLSLSPNGLLLATASSDKTVKVFSVLELRSREHRKIDKKRLEKLEKERFNHEERVRKQRLDELHKQSHGRIEGYKLTLKHIFDGGVSSVSGGGGDVEALHKLLYEFPELSCSAVLWQTEGMTPLMKACQFGMTLLFNIIIWKADVVKTINKQDAVGDTALHHASRGGHTDIVRHLLDHGAKPSVANLKNLRPVEVCHGEDVRILLSGHKHKLQGGALVTEAATPSPKKSWFKNSAYVYHSGAVEGASPSIALSMNSLNVTSSSSPSVGSPRASSSSSSSAAPLPSQLSVTEVDYWLDDIGLGEYKGYFRDDMGACKLVRLRQFVAKSPKELAEEFPKLKKFSVYELHRQLQRLTDLKVAGYKCRKLDADKAERDRRERARLGGAADMSTSAATTTTTPPGTTKQHRRPDAF